MASRASVQLGEIIRQQRELAEMSMRQFADLAGISNPYLSQIERGLRAPSEHVLEGIAGALKVSADALYKQAGMSPPGEEQAEIEQVPVRDVAELVAEDRRDLVIVQVIDQGIGQQDVAEPGQGTRHPGVDQGVPCVPDQNIGATEPEPMRQPFQAVTQRTRG